MTDRPERLQTAAVMRFAPIEYENLTDKVYRAIKDRILAQDIEVGARLRDACLVPTLHHAEKIPGESRELLDAQLGIYRFDDLAALKSA